MSYPQPKPPEHHHPNWPATQITYPALVLCNTYMWAVYFFGVTWRWGQQIPPKRWYKKKMVYYNVFHGLTAVIITNNSYRTKVSYWVQKLVKKNNVHDLRHILLIENLWKSLSTWRHFAGNSIYLWNCTRSCVRTGLKPLWSMPGNASLLVLSFMYTLSTCLCMRVCTCVWQSWDVKEVTG